MSFFGALIFALASPPAWPCKVAPASGYDSSAGSSETPPAVRITNVAVTLGKNYGGPGPGDCSQLGKVVITLQADDGAVLDGRFGAKLLVSAGAHPATAINLETWVAPIKDNQVVVTISDDKPTVDFAVAVRAVNAEGDVGE